MKPPHRAPAASLLDAVTEFMRLESAGGLCLLAATFLAMVAANSPLAPTYGALLDTPVSVQVGALAIDKPLLLWINDGLMAIFFFLVGLEVKREFLEGELSSPSQVVLPGLGALGGMLVPAGIYVAFNRGDTVALDGWAIPVATDIAFALGVLGAFGRRVPVSLKAQLAFYDVRDVYLLGTNLWHSNTLIKMAPQYVQGAIMPDGFFAGSAAPAVQDFVKTFEDTYEEKPGFIEAIVYDSAMMLFSVLIRPDLRFKSELKNELLNLVDFSGITGPTYFDENGEAQKQLYLLKVKGKRFVELEQ